MRRKIRRPDPKRFIVLAFSPNPRFKDSGEFRAKQVTSSAMRWGGVCVEQVVITDAAAVASLEPHLRHFINRKREKNDFDTLVLCLDHMPPDFRPALRRTAKAAQEVGMSISCFHIISEPRCFGPKQTKEVGRD